MPANQISRVLAYNHDPNKKLPVAIILPAEQEVVLGSVVRLDGTASFDPSGRPITYQWSYFQLPIGSQLLRDPIDFLETDQSVISLAPDIVGQTVVQLVVNNGLLDSDPAYAFIDTRALLVPHNKGIIPDASFIWNFISDFWGLVEGRRRFEVFWSAAIQLVASELLKAYQIDYNKSIKDIQSLFQRRWISYSPELSLDSTKVSFILADDAAGLTASTTLIDPKSGIVSNSQPDYSTLVTVPSSEGNFQQTAYGLSILQGRLLRVGNRSFTLARGGQLSLSLNYGTDGHSHVPVAGVSDFGGSGFVAQHLGQLLRVLSGPNQGTYLISQVVSSILVRVTALDGSPPILTDVASLIYSVLPARPANSAFYADIADVPTRLDNQAWRMSATLSTSEFDLEKQGVHPGDILEVTVSRADNSRTSTLRCQIVSVDRERAGVVFNLEDLVDGVAAGGLALSDQLTLASDLDVPGILATVDGTYLYTDQSGVVFNTLKSIAFRRAFYERVLTPRTDINLGPFSVRLTPTKVIRTNAIPVAPEVMSIPALQEYIKAPDVSRQTDGTLVQVTADGVFPLSREPYVLIENLDYILDDESTIRGVCNLTAGSEIVEIPFGDLLARSVREGDTLEVTAGASVERFTILKVLDEENLRVFPTTTLDAPNVSFALLRQTPGKFIRFVRGSFSNKKIPPGRLWAEISYFDNNDVVEGNFGFLVNVTLEDLKKQRSSIPYKSSVAGLMYALTKGPTLENLQLAAQILFGLPFTEHAGVITRIDPKYRVRVDGSPLYGRVVVEARDKNNKPVGLSNIYQFPQGAQLSTADDGSKDRIVGSVVGPWFVSGQSMDIVIDGEPPITITFTGANPLALDQVVSQANRTVPGLASESGVGTNRLAVTTPRRTLGSSVSVLGVAAGTLGLLNPSDPNVFLASLPELSGLGINPNTGVEFQVGDHVDQFIPLSKGVQVQDYISTPDWFQQFVDQGNVGAGPAKYHSFQLLVNADVTSSEDVDLVARFLRDARLHYTKMYVTLLRAFSDQVGIDDDIIFTFGSPPIFFDNVRFSLPTATKFDEGVAEMSFLSSEGTMHSWYLSGTDLVTVQGISVVTSATGGFVNTVPGSGQSHDTPFIQAGDLLIIQTGFNKGRFKIAGVPDDSTLILDLGFSTTLFSAANQGFRIYRPIQNPIFTPTLEVFNGNPVVRVIGTDGGAGIFSAGVAVGDSLVFYDVVTRARVSKRYTVQSVDLFANTLTVLPTPSEPTSTYRGAVLRDGLLTKYLMSTSADVPYVATYAPGDPKVTFDTISSDLIQMGAIRPGDLLIPNVGGAFGGAVFSILRWDPNTSTAYVTPAPNAGIAGNLPTKIQRPGRASTVIYTTMLDAMPGEALNLLLRRRSSGGGSGSDLTTTAGSNVVSTVSGEDFVLNNVVPGDYVHITAGPDSSINIGFGAGVYPIDTVLTPTQLALTNALTATEGSPGVAFVVVKNTPAGRDLTTSAASNITSTVSGENFVTMGVRPGDYLHILEGPDSLIDTGLGPGVYVIVSLPATTQLALADALTSTQAAPGYLYGIRRSRPNDGQG